MVVISRVAAALILAGGLAHAEYWYKKEKFDNIPKPVHHQEVVKQSAPLQESARLQAENQRLVAKVDSLEAQVTALKERIAGLSSVVDSLSSQKQAAAVATTAATTAVVSGGVASDSQAKRIAELEAKLARLEAQKSAAKQAVVAAKPTAVTTSATATKPAIAVEPKPVATPLIPAEKLSYKDAYAAGVKLYKQKRYMDAKRYFIKSDIGGYKSAESNYYLGELCYYSKQYNDAIFYYKKSAGLNDQASYIDVILLHAAISLEKTNQKDQAKLFFENIIENYPTKKSASIAKEHLKKL